MPPPPVPRKRKGRSPSPMPESSVSPPPSEGDSEYDPRGMRGAPPPRPKGKKGGPSPPSGAQAGKSATKGRPMSREQLRKANHSLIERRRREKINSALADLRAMVPGLGEENGGKGGEFKLEVLERTVEHMRELKRHVAQLEQQLGPAPKRRRTSTTDESMDVDTEDSRSLPAFKRSPRSPLHHNSSPPSPSMTPSPGRVVAAYDPNETEDEANLPPPLSMASRASDESSKSHTSHTSTASPHPPSISSLLSSAHPPAPVRTQSSRGAPPSASPNIYLPFPTPSPTSPFLSYHPSNASTASSATGPPEPSPFLAPLQNISLFDGQLSHSPLNGPMKRSPPEDRRPEHDKGGMGAEEAASLLLSISSPDTMRPTGPNSSTGTPLITVAHSRRLTLDDEEFTLDGGHVHVGARDREREREHDVRVRVHRTTGPHTQGKTARDILRM